MLIYKNSTREGLVDSERLTPDGEFREAFRSGISQHLCHREEGIRCMGKMAKSGAQEKKMPIKRHLESREWLIHKKKFSGMTDVRRMAYLCTVDVDDEVTGNRGQGMRSCSSEGLIPYVQFSKAVSVRLKPYLCIRFQTATARTWRD